MVKRYLVILIALLLAMPFGLADTFITDRSSDWSQTVTGGSTSASISLGESFTTNVNVKFLNQAEKSAFVTYIQPLDKDFPPTYIGTSYKDTIATAGTTKSYSLTASTGELTNLQDAFCDKYFLMFVHHYTCLSGQTTYKSGLSEGSICSLSSDCASNSCQSHTEYQTVTSKKASGASCTSGSECNSGVCSAGTNLQNLNVDYATLKSSCEGSIGGVWSSSPSSISCSGWTYSSSMVCGNSNVVQFKSVCQGAGGAWTCSSGTIKCSVSSAGGSCTGAAQVLPVTVKSCSGSPQVINGGGSCTEPSNGQSFTGGWKYEGYTSRMQNTPKINCKPACETKTLETTCWIIDGKNVVAEKRQAGDCSTKYVPIEECAGLCLQSACLNDCDYSSKRYCKDGDVWKSVISVENNCEAKESLDKECEFGCDGSSCVEEKKECTIASDCGSTEKCSGEAFVCENDACKKIAVTLGSDCQSCGDGFCAVASGETEANCPVDCRKTICTDGEVKNVACTGSTTKQITYTCVQGDWVKSGSCATGKWEQFKEWLSELPKWTYVIAGVVLICGAFIIKPYLKGKRRKGK